MTKVAHHHPHHPRAYEVMGKAQEWFGKIIIAAAIVGGAIVLFGALNSHGNVTW